MIILYSKSMRLFVGSGFLVSHCGLCKPRHFYDLSPLGTMSNHNWWVFHSRGDLSLLTDTRHIFSLPFSSVVRLYWTLSHLTEPTKSTPNVVSTYQPCTHTQLNAMSPCICNAKMPLHVILCYMYNTLHITTYKLYFMQSTMDNYIKSI